MSETRTYYTVHSRCKPGAIIHTVQIDLPVADLGVDPDAEVSHIPPYLVRDTDIISGAGFNHERLVAEIKALRGGS